MTTVANGRCTSAPAPVATAIGTKKPSERRSHETTAAKELILADHEGNIEAQRKAIYDAVVAKFGADAAKDRESVLKAVDAAFTMAGSKIDLTKLLIDLKKHGEFHEKSPAHYSARDARLQGTIAMCLATS